MKKIAIYDMDRTITRIGTYTPFLLFAAKRRPWRLPGMLVFFLSMAGYPLGLIGRKTIKQLGFRIALGSRVSPGRLAAIAAAYADHVLTHNLHPHVAEQIAADKAEGCTLVMATAAPHFYADEIGARLGFDHVLATRQERAANGDYLQTISGDNCYGAAKLRMIEQWLPVAREATEIRFYSDHHSDEPVLAWCDIPVAANPKQKMRALAQTRGWRILSRP